MTFDLRRAEPGRSSVMTWLLIVPTIVFAFFATCIATDTPAILRTDARVADWAYDITAGRPRLVDALDVVAIVFSNAACAIALALMAIYALVRRERVVALWVVLSGIVGIGGNALLKQLFTRTRPSFDEPLHEIGGYSFPSGHSAGAGMFFTVAVLFTIILTGRGLKRRVLVTILVLLALGVGASRIFLGVHYLSDVVAGLSFGMAVTIGLWMLIVGGSSRVPYAAAMITGSGRKRVAVVINPSKIADVEDFKTRVRTVAEGSGWNEPIWFETSVEDPGHGQATAALAQGVDLIIAAGGDGTVRAVCEKAARSGTAVGIIPLGTGNLLARNLAIPLNTRDALDVAFGGQDRAIDLSTLETDSGTSTSFLVMAGLGMDAAIMTGVNDQLKSRVGWLAYFVSGIKAARFPAMKVQITVDDGEPRKFRARTVVVGNVGFLQGGIPLLPDAQIDDGLLDVVVIAPKRFIGWLAIIVRIVGRRKRTNERLDRLTGQKVHVRAEKPVPMQLDGDPVGEGQEITAQVQPGILLVRVPVAPASA
ncbi:phosphatase PAP2 family protein [Aeromicrobium wangtongii]|uniref:phosphatase PAP2 family protein n=1 Tax=Aeromicrobium wangtongii TaxID=2969247 RepID=UPI0020173320|nr:phosphatase PAP2 family protein [Aeromicrobium wangtongii]MCL3817217.1 phosphatase PAP2 family protein [Aeromicrobium wangtongii]